jgi:photosystem II stability/assembly factor-like uncharacterized protein
MDLRRDCRRVRPGLRAPAALACAGLIAFLAAAAPDAAAGAQWRPISPDLGTATALGGGRFWSSHDGGAHWAKVGENSLLGAVPVGQVVVDRRRPGRIYVLSYGVGGTVFRSDDGGATWVTHAAGQHDPVLAIGLAGSGSRYAGSRVRR